MDQPLSPLALIAIWALPLIGVFLYFALRRRSTTQGWSKLSEQIGLSLEPGGSPDVGPRLTGLYRGHVLVIETIRTGGARQSSTSTHIKFEVKRVDTSRVELRYTSTAMSAKMRKSVTGFYRELVEIGDAEIDKHFMVNTPSAPYARRLLARDGSVFAPVERLFIHLPYGSLRLDGSQVDFAMALETKEDKLQSALAMVSEVAEAVEQMR